MTTVALIFRRPLPGGYFSIERSFYAVQKSLTDIPGILVKPVMANRVSKRLLPRLMILWQMACLKAQVYHITGDIHFAALALPGKRTVLTIHDCGFMRHPNRLARWILGIFWLKWPVRHCRVITAVSESTKQEIVRITACPEEKIFVVPTVIPADFQPAPKVFNAGKPRILHIGSSPNKNLPRHIEALNGIPCTLHIIGRLGDVERQWLAANNIAYMHDYDLSETEIAKAFIACDLLLFASTFEGFGMPVLEAQSVGRPVVTSNCSSMPEVAGSGACLVDPTDIESIRKGVLRIIHDEKYRTRLIEAGFMNVKRFQSEEVARQYAALYTHCFSSKQD